MKTKTTNLSGLVLIVLGVAALMHTMILPLFGVEAGLWRLWPLLVAGVGFAFVLTPFASREKRGLGMMFIPGVPIVMVSGLLFVSSMFNWWSSWELFWPLIIIALALGFAAAAIQSRVVWLFIPAIILGANGLVFQFCSLTGWWELWSILWTIEPLSVGLALIFLSMLTKRQGLMTAGLIVTAVAGVGFSIMAMVLSGWTAILGSIMLIVVGGALLLNNVRRQDDYLIEEKTPKEKLADSTYQ
ncbi:MAG: hypothetical protein DWQ04_06430 [Chloroflexi bacterium]|nr:MAG: hypothetical protein DWQ04_06430 [Chloroflexota bacterium]